MRVGSMYISVLVLLYGGVGAVSGLFCAGVNHD